MSADTVIQWAHDSVNFWWGCTKVSRGCRKCYAAAMAARLSKGRATWGPAGKRMLRVGEACQELLRLERRAQRRGESRRVFINSMADTFEDHPALESARTVLFTIPPCVPQLNLLLLTKRPENVRRMVPAEWLTGKWPRNVWLGVSVEDQATADARIPLLLGLPAPLRFLSIEPIVERVRLGMWLRLEEVTPMRIDDGRVVPIGPTRVQRAPKSEVFPEETIGIHWVIAGGESGHGAIPCDLDWLRSLRDQCAAAAVPFFCKQLGRIPVSTAYSELGEISGILRLDLKDGHGGDMAEWPEDLRVRQLPEAP